MKNRLRVPRADRDWTQAGLADQLQGTRKTINAAEKGKYGPSLPLAFKIATLFGLPIEEIFAPDTYKPYFMRKISHQANPFRGESAPEPLVIHPANLKRVAVGH